VRANYSPEQIEHMVMDYEAMRERRDTDTRGSRLYTLLILADFDRALQQLSGKYYEAVLLHGLIGVPIRNTAELLQINPKTVVKRYRKGLEELHYLMNGVP
jgi:DNA-directed RNA polymerase specialized sigma24 family protein